MSLCRFYVAALSALAGCQDPPRSKAEPPAPPAPVIAVDAKGATLAELRVGRPCRASIGPQEMIVGGPPIVSTVGSTSWTGEDGENGTTLIRAGERIARVFPVGADDSGAVIDLHGVAQARVKVVGQTATVEDKASIPVRRLTLADNKIVSDDPAMTITGTSDLVLAALLTAPELLPEVRMLAACQRVLVKDKK